MKAFPPISSWQTRLRHWAAQLPTSAGTAVEDSVGLRISVQILVSVGIVATDVAAGSMNSLWAIPLSILGSTWSWYRRRRRNIVAKFGIAIGMLVVLGAMLARLLSNAGDTRLLLAELLIQLQVLHTFDLPRRKDLGYSAVIGLILIAVAATISETMTFGIFLVLFVAIALPVLLLDYRSRLGLQPLRAATAVAKIPWRRIGLLLGAVLGLGLLIFAAVPRVPGYQFRTFPVAGQVSIQDRFDPAQIFNPGYVQSGKDGIRGGSRRQTMGQGETPTFNSKFYYGFNAEMDQTLGGSLKPETVMRVRSQAAGFWRMMAFDDYTGRGWRVSRNEASSRLSRQPWSYRFVLPFQSVVGRSKEIVQSFSILTEFPNLLPALAQAREVYFPAQEIAIDPEGGIRAPSSLDEGLTYSIVSAVPYRDRTQLNRARTRYPDVVRRVYLPVPEAIAPQVRTVAEGLLAKANRPLPTPYEKALYLTQVLKQTYTLQPTLPPLQPDQDLVLTFLTEWKGGYPDHFASALTLMLRSLGIPARLTTGFAPGEFNPFTGLYEVKNTDAYALTEVYIPGQGWFAFDPIPGHDLYPPSLDETQTFPVLSQFWNWIAGWLPSPVVGWIGSAVALLAGMIAQMLGLLSQGWAGFLVFLLICGSVGLAGWGLWQAWHAWHTWRQLRRLPPMARLYRQMVLFLAEDGYQKGATETPLEYAHQICRDYPPYQGEIIAELTQAYIAWHYGGITPDLPYLQQRWQLLRRKSSSRGRSRTDKPLSV